jgi:GT2 family glycosyltransferase
MSHEGTLGRHARIAIIYDNTVRPDTTGEYCRRALEAMGHTVSHYLPTEVGMLPAIYDLYLRVDDDLDYELPDDLRPLAYWAIDTHREYPARARRARAADFPFCAQQNGAARMRADGIPAHWLPLACDPQMHAPIPGSAKLHDIAFVGHTFAGDGDRTRLVEWIRTTVPRAFVGRAYGADMARIYSAARLVFNCPIRDDVNMRVFEAVACGSLLLTRDLAANGQDLLFTPGQHLAVYRDEAELREQVARYLADDRAREEIAEAGMRHAHARHTYRQRMTDLVAVALEGASLDATYPVERRAPSAEHGVSPTAVGGPEPQDRRTAGPDQPSAVRRPPSAASPVVSIAVPAEGRPLVSIIIPTFNHRAMTERCVASIRGATTLPYEILIVDNGSMDGTGPWARGQGLRVIANGENRGFPAACNQGIRAADGVYLLLLNNDTVVSPGWLDRLLAHAQADPAIGLVAPSTNFAGNCQQIPADYGTHEGFLTFAERLAVAHAGEADEADALIGLCLLIPRGVVEAVGLLDERFGLGNFEDIDYSLRVRLAGYRLRWARNVFIHHEGHQSFRELGDGFGKLLEANERRYVEKWTLGRYAMRHQTSNGSGRKRNGNGQEGQLAGPQAESGADPWTLLEAGRYAAAYEAFETLVLRDRTSVRHLLGLGLAAEGRGAPAAAALAYRGVLAMAPDSPEAARGLSRVAGMEAIAGPAPRAEGIA